VGVEIQVFLTSALVGGEYSASRPGRFTTGEELPVRIGWEAGWAPVGLNDMEKWKVLIPTGLELRLLIVEPVASRYTDYATAARRWKTLFYENYIFKDLFDVFFENHLLFSSCLSLSYRNHCFLRYIIEVLAVVLRLTWIGSVGQPRDYQRPPFALRKGNWWAA
jgi:hypothetical protein